MIQELASWLVVEPAKDSSLQRVLTKKDALLAVLSAALLARRADRCAAICAAGSCALRNKSFSFSQ